MNLNRQPLLETLVTKQITRTGGVYLFRPTVGPPAVSSQKIDRFLHDVNQRFDLGPILKGDQQQSRQLAFDYMRFVKSEAERLKVPKEETMKRLRNSLPHIKRSLLTFFTYLDALVKTKR